MIIAEAWCDSGALDDIRITGLHECYYIVESDFSKVEEALGEVDCTELLNTEWYEFKLKPKYEDDGSGAQRMDWYEIVETNLLIDFNAP